MKTITFGHRYDPLTGKEKKDELWIQFDVEDNGRSHSIRLSMKKAELAVLVEACKAHIFDELVM